MTDQKNKLPDGVDPNIVETVKSVVPFLKNKASGLETISTTTYLDNNGRTGARVTANSAAVQLSTAPGGGIILLWGSAYPTPVMSLDFANDIRDEYLRTMRRSVAYTLEQHDIKFLPVSMNAASRLGGNYPNYKVVDQVGLECVFRDTGKSDKPYYLSGYDDNESPSLYFLARLPRRVDSIKDAREALKPESVKEAERLGLKVLRQGDMFAIPSPYNTADLKRMDATVSNQIEWETKEYVGNPILRCHCDECKRQFARYLEMNPDNGYIIKKNTRKRGLYGTAHTATEIAFLPDGTMFARGEIVHDPQGVLREGRNPDHAALKLPGKKWYLVVRNTVPVNPSARRNRR